MKSATDLVLKSSLFASAAAVAILSAPGFAQAQAPARADAADVEEIVVTGSRIRRPELTSVNPIQVITTESLEERGFTNVADALNELPSSGVPINPIGDQGSFGTGRNFINIFNLGSNRTLTLVNGRRFVGGNPASIFTGAGAGGQVDLNVIPTGLIDRIDTIQAGGSAVYGSDAIAGVINIITKTEYDGIEIDGLYGVSDENDAETYRGRIVAGKKFLDDRLSLFGSYEYNETSPLAFVDRAVTRRQIAFANNPLNTSGSDNIPGAILIQNRRIPELTFGGLLTRTAGIGLNGILVSNPTASTGRSPVQLAPNGTLVPFDPGIFYQATIASGGDGANLGELSSLQSPVKRHVANAFVKYDVTDDIRVNFEGLYAHNSSVEPFNQPIYNSGVFGGFGAASGPLRFSTANPLLPAATRAAILAQAGPQTVAAVPGQNPLATPPATTTLPALTPDPNSPGDVFFFLHRASIDVGSNKTSSESETYRGVASIEGDLNFFDRDFHWDLNASQGVTKGNFQSPNIDQNRFLAATNIIGTTPANAMCADAAARAAGCVPLNLFGLGAPSAAALAYVQVQFRTEFRIQQTDYSANFGGNIWELPAGWARFNVGYEYRHEKSDFNPNDPQEAGVGRSAAISALIGKFHTNEYYGEIAVPIFGPDFNFLGMHSLEVEGQYRHVKHSLAGKDEAWSYGGRWSPFADLVFRGHKSKSFRAPAITELFLPNATSFFTATDPCHFANINSGPNPTARAANCAAAFTALGLPANFSLTSQVQAATVQGFTSGNPNLENEVADQWSLGFVYQPSFLPGLAISFDWVDIEIKKAIANFTLTNILQVCYDSPTFPNAACSRFQRGTSATAGRQGQILTFGEPVGNGTNAAGAMQGFINAGYTNFKGFTAGIDYRIDLADALGGVFADTLNGNPGRLGVNFDLFYEDKLQTSPTGLGFDLNRNEGEIGDSTWQWKNEITWARDPWKITWTTNYISGAVFNNDFTIETRHPLRVKEYYVNDVAFVYDLSNFAENLGVGLDAVRARFIVKNVFDKEAPYGTTGLAVYDAIGRYFEFGLTARF